MSTVLLLPAKPARKLILKTSGLAALVVVVGCQQQIKPPVTEIPTTEKIQSSIPKKQADTDVAIEPSLPEQIDWNRRSREIARTELSPFLREQATKVIEKPKIESPPAIPPKSSQDKIEGIPQSKIRPQPKLLVKHQHQSLVGLQLLLSKDPTKTAAKLLSQNQPESAILTINGVDPRTLSASQRAEILRIKASAYRQLNMTIAALRFDAERLRYIESETLVIVARKILEELEPITQKNSLGFKRWHRSSCRHGARSSAENDAELRCCLSMVAKIS